MHVNRGLKEDVPCASCFTMMDSSQYSIYIVATLYYAKVCQEANFEADMHIDADGLHMHEIQVLFHLSNTIFACGQARHIYSSYKHVSR